MDGELLHYARQHAGGRSVGFLAQVQTAEERQQLSDDDVDHVTLRFPERVEARQVDR